MKKIVEKSLEAALIKASNELGCSVADLEYEIVQNPSGGFLGIGKKEAIIIVDTKGEHSSQNAHPSTSQNTPQNTPNGDQNFENAPKRNHERNERHGDRYAPRYAQSRSQNYPQSSVYGSRDEERESYGSNAHDEYRGYKEDYKKAANKDYGRDYGTRFGQDLESREVSKASSPKEQSSYGVSIGESMWQDESQSFKSHTKAQNPKKAQNLQSLKDPYDSDIWGDESVGSFQNSFNTPKAQEYGWEKAVRKSTQAPSNTQNSNDEANILEIKNEIKALFALLPFEIDRFEVSMEENNTLYVYIDGRDCALLIGERGYRYKALSYLLFNWINPKYGYSLRLEIAEFLKNQEEMIDVYLKDIVRLIKLNGRAQTKTLDGILVYIALTKLREMFPDKYVSVRQNEALEKYIIINDFRR